METLLELPFQHVVVRLGATSWTNSRTGAIVQPVTTAEIKDSYHRRMTQGLAIGERAIRDVIRDIETMGLVETWINSKGTEGRVTHIETTFAPEWIRDLEAEYISQLPQHAEL